MPGPPKHESADKTLISVTMLNLLHLSFTTLFVSVMILVLSVLTCWCFHRRSSRSCPDSEAAASQKLPPTVPELPTVPLDTFPGLAVGQAPGAKVSAKGQEAAPAAAAADTLTSQFDVIIVGAGVVGCAAAAALGKQGANFVCEHVCI